MKYSIVVPTYNHCDDLLRPCLESVFQYSHMRDIELIISANGCFDNTREYLTELQKSFHTLGMEDHFKVIWNDKPLGFSKAVNVGIQATSQDLVLLLSNDVRLLPQPKNNWLERLRAPFDEKETCGITCTNKMHSEHAGRAFAIFFCVMIHKRVFDTIGLLNESYGVGSGEDIEFSIETELAGFDVVEVAENHMDHNLKMWISDFPLFHKGEGTVHDTNLVKNWEKIFTTNMLRVAKKYNPLWLQTHEHLLPKEILAELSVPHENLGIAKTLNFPLYRDIFEANCYAVDLNEFTDHVVVDVGAHVGMFSLFSLQRGAKSVVAIEAHPETFRVYLGPVVKNISNIKALNLAMLDSDLASVGIEGHDVSARTMRGSREGAQVMTVSLATLLEKERLRDEKLVLKLNVEGDEFDILLSTPCATLKLFSSIFVETHNNKNTNPKYQNREVIQQHLEGCGFKKIRETPLLWFGSDGTTHETGIWNEKYIRVAQ